MSEPSSSISSSSIMPFILSSIGRFLSSGASSLSLKTISNLLSWASGKLWFFLLAGTGGGGNTGSTPILKHNRLEKVCYLLEGVFNHGWNESRKIGARKLETRIGVHLNYPRDHVFVYHEVVTVDLAGIGFAIRVDLSRDCSHRVTHHLFHFGNHLLDEVTGVACRIQVLLKLCITKLIATFEFAIIIKLLLDCIIGKMDKPVGNILKSELTATCPQIAIGVPIALKITIYGRHQSKTPDIKLTVFVE